MDRNPCFGHKLQKKFCFVLGASKRLIFGQHTQGRQTLFAANLQQNRLVSMSTRQKKVGFVRGVDARVDQVDSDWQSTPATSRLLRKGILDCLFVCLFHFVVVAVSGASLQLFDEADSGNEMRIRTLHSRNAFVVDSSRSQGYCHAWNASIPKH